MRRSKGHKGHKKFKSTITSDTSGFSPDEVANLTAASEYMATLIDDARAKGTRPADIFVVICDIRSHAAKHFTRSLIKSGMPHPPSFGHLSVYGFGRGGGMNTVLLSLAAEHHIEYVGDADADYGDEVCMISILPSCIMAKGVGDTEFRTRPVASEPPPYRDITPEAALDMTKSAFALAEKLQAAGHDMTTVGIMTFEYKTPFGQFHVRGFEETTGIKFPAPEGDLVSMNFERNGVDALLQCCAAEFGLEILGTLSSNPAAIPVVIITRDVRVMSIAPPTPTNPAKYVCTPALRRMN